MLWASGGGASPSTTESSSTMAAACFGQKVFAVRQTHLRGASQQLWLSVGTCALALLEEQRGGPPRPVQSLTLSGIRRCIATIGGVRIVVVPSQPPAEGRRRQGGRKARREGTAPIDIVLQTAQGAEIAAAITEAQLVLARGSQEAGATARESEPEPEPEPEPADVLPPPLRPLRQGAQVATLQLKALKEMQRRVADQMIRSTWELKHEVRSLSASSQSVVGAKTGEVVWPDAGLYVAAGVCGGSHPARSWASSAHPRILRCSSCRRACPRPALVSHCSSWQREQVAAARPASPFFCSRSAIPAAPVMVIHRRRGLRKRPRNSSFWKAASQACWSVHGLRM
jgi:hypothetical protein